MQPKDIMTIVDVITESGGFSLHYADENNASNAYAGITSAKTDDAKKVVLLSDDYGRNAMFVSSAIIGATITPLMQLIDRNAALQAYQDTEQRINAARAYSRHHAQGELKLDENA